MHTFFCLGPTSWSWTKKETLNPKDCETHSWKQSTSEISQNEATCPKVRGFPFSKKQADSGFARNLFVLHWCLYISQFKNYLAYTIGLLNYYSSKVFQLTTYNDFNIVNQTKLNTLMLLHDELNKISPFSFSFSKVSEIGHIMCVFYKIYGLQFMPHIYHTQLKI